MSVELEREKTYLVSKLPADLSLNNSALLRDIYIPEGVGHARLRLRQKGDSYEMTKKIPVIDGDSSRQTEHTIPLTREEFEALATSSQKSLQKRRYFTKINGYDAEVDIYEDKLAGLVVVDFEFATEEDFLAFVRPVEMLADVTQDEVVGGGFLAGKSYEDIEARLRAYGYERISV